MVNAVPGSSSTTKTVREGFSGILEFYTIALSKRLLSLHFTAVRLLQSGIAALYLLLGYREHLAGGIVEAFGFGLAWNVWRWQWFRLEVAFFCPVFGIPNRAAACYNRC